MVTLNPSQATRVIAVSKIGTVIYEAGIPTPIYEGEPFNIACVLRNSAGLPVEGKTINVYYTPAGAGAVYVGSRVTDYAGAISMAVTIPTAGSNYVILYEFSGDAEYEGSWVESALFDVLVSVINTTLTISAPSSVGVNESFEISGQLRRNDTAEGVVGETINLSYNGVNLGSITTGGGGFYGLTVSIAEAGSFTLKAEFMGAIGLAGSSAMSTINSGEGPSLLGVVVGAIALGVASALIYLGRR